MTPITPASLTLATFPPELPVTDPVLVFAIAVTAFLVAPLLIERARVPGIVGIILVGTTVGPNGLGVLQRGETVVLLGTVGIVYLMFLAGLEIDLREFRANRAESVGFGLTSFVVPQAVGTVVGVYALGFGLLTALLFASVFASHTLLAYPVARRLGIGDNRAVTTTIGGTMLTDTLALLVLAVVAGAHAGEITPGFWLRLGGGLALFFVGTWVLVPLIARWFFGWLTEESYFEYLFVLAVAFAAAYAAEVAGVEAIIGAFLAGLALNPLVPRSGVLMNRVEFVGNALFIPFFLLSVGMLVDPLAILDGPDTVVVTVALVAMTLATKAGSSAIAGWRYGWTPAEVGASFGLSVGQAAAALAVTLVGFEIGLFDRTIVNAVVLMILVISLLAPAITARYGADVAVAEGRTGYDADEAPDRVLVPIARDSLHGRSLLDVALLLRDPGSTEPISVVTVIPPGSPESMAADVVEAEAATSAAEGYAAGAAVPVDARTRVEANVATGIARAATESLASRIVIGWDGARSRRQATFGTTIDGVLRATDDLVWVTRAQEPLNTTTRIVLLLPPNVEHNGGFAEAVHAVKTYATGLDAVVHAVPVEGNAETYRSLLESVVPDATVSVEDPVGWKGLLRMLGDDVRETDTVVCLSARRGHLGWHPQLQTLPKSISTLVDGNFAVVYPPTAPRSDDRRFMKLR